MGSDACAAPGAPPPPPFWRLLERNAPPLPISERQLLIALDTHLAPLRCAAGTRVLVVGSLGCAAHAGAAAATATLAALRAGLPFADITLVDGDCAPEAGLAAATALRATWGGDGATARAGGPAFHAVVLRDGDGAGDPLPGFSAFRPAVAPGGVLVAAGMASSYTGGGDGSRDGTLAGLLQLVMDHNHCLPDRIASPECDHGGFGGDRALLGAVKSVDCSPGVCAALLYSDAERQHLSDGGAHANELRNTLPALQASLPAARKACTPLDAAGGDETLWALGLAAGTDKVFDPHAKGSTHWYQEPYTRHIAKRRCGIKNMLEVGLGCDMHYAPGAAFPVWLDFVPNAHVAYMECVCVFHKSGATAVRLFPPHLKRSLPGTTRPAWISLGQRTQSPSRPPLAQTVGPYFRATS